MEIAFLGLGRMGQLMAGHLLDAGHSVRVWNRSPGKAGELTARGATEADTPAAAVHGADVALLMLFDADACRSVLLDGADPVVEGAAPGMVVCNCSTIGVPAAQALGEALGARGLGYVDAPVAGSTPVAAKGELGVLLGGADADVEKVRPLVATFGGEGKVRHLGGVGAGQAMKLVVNATIGYALLGVGEALRLADDLDLDRETTLAVLAGGPLGGLVGQKQDSLARQDYSTANFAAAALSKDLDLAADVARTPLPGLALARAAAHRTLAEGAGDSDIAAVADRA